MEERTRRALRLAYLIHREWWRPLRNRRRRQEIRTLAAEDERDHQAQPVE